MRPREVAQRTVLSSSPPLPFFLFLPLSSSFPLSAIINVLMADDWRLLDSLVTRVEPADDHRRR